MGQTVYLNSNQLNKTVNKENEREGLKEHFILIVSPVAGLFFRLCCFQ